LKKAKTRMADTKPPTTSLVCPSCKTALLSEANFCHSCGHRLAPDRAGRKVNFGMIAVFGVIAIGVGAITITAITVDQSGRNQRTPQTAATTTPGPTSPNLPDLSTMTPRQAADRLFNRIMTATERGDAAEAARFAPMALQAYQRVGRLDADAHYHIALIHLAVSNTDGARGQVDLIRQLVPHHLLGFTLEHMVASLAGDTDGMARAYAGFVEAYPQEISSGRSEYQGHRNHIDQFRAAKGRSLASKSSAVVASAEPVSRLFVTHCGSCHGQNAQGSKEGPPLIHRLYASSHHSDEAFLRAIRQGAKAHHWSFGDMPPVAGVSDADIKQIVAHVRSLQKAAGID